MPSQEAKGLKVSVGDEHESGKAESAAPAQPPTPGAAKDTPMGAQARKLAADLAGLLVSSVMEASVERVLERTGEQGDMLGWQPASVLTPTVPPPPPSSSRGGDGESLEAAEVAEAAVRIQAASRGRVGRRELAESRAAATKVQAVQRGRQGRRAARARAQARTASSEVSPAGAGRREVQEELVEELVVASIDGAVAQASPRAPSAAASVLSEAAVLEASGLGVLLEVGDELAAVEEGLGRAEAAAAAHSREEQAGVMTQSGQLRGGSGVDGVPDGVASSRGGLLPGGAQRRKKKPKPKPAGASTSGGGKGRGAAAVAADAASGALSALEREEQRLEAAAAQVR
eukprot:COSAG01_NODE_511_length_16061_cov_15.815875_4_plen_344_part_00